MSCWAAGSHHYVMLGSSESSLCHAGQDTTTCHISGAPSDTKSCVAGSMDHAVVTQTLKSVYSWGKLFLRLLKVLHKCSI